MIPMRNQSLVAEMEMLSDLTQFGVVKHYYDHGHHGVSIVAKVLPGHSLAEVAALLVEGEVQEAEYLAMLGRVFVFVVPDMSLVKPEHRHGCVSFDDVSPDLWVDVILIPPVYICQSRADKTSPSSPPSTSAFCGVGPTYFTELLLVR